MHWKDWCWTCSFNTLTTWCEERTHWKRPWCCERLKAGGEGDDKGKDVWMASLTQWTWVWSNSGRWWRTGKPGVLQSLGSQRVGHDWGTENNMHTYTADGNVEWCWCFGKQFVNSSKGKHRVTMCALCARLLHLCPTFCNSMDCSLPGFFVQVTIWSNNSTLGCIPKRS